MPTIRSLFSLFLTLVISALLVSPSAQAGDDGARFVEALRQQGYYELALEFLDAAPQDALTTDAFRQRIPYERAITLLDQTKALSDPGERRAAIDSARASLDAFASSSDKALAAEAKSRLAGAMTLDAQMSVTKAQQLTTAGDKAGAEAILKTARQSFDDALKLYQSSNALYGEELQNYKAVKPKSPEAEQRLELRVRRAQTQLLASRLLYYQATAYEKGSKEFKELNETAAKQLGELFAKYSSWLVGFYAHLYEGQCYQALDQHKLAISCFENLVEQPADEPVFRQLVTMANAYLAASLNAEGKPDDVLKNQMAWIEDLPSGEANTPAALALKYQVARAAQLAAAKLTGSDARRMLGKARPLLRAAARGQHEFLAEARTALSEVNAALGATAGPLNSFADAYQAGRDAIGSLGSATIAVDVAKKNNPSAVEELQQQIDDSRIEALRAFRAAVTLVDDDTKLSQLNDVRRFLCWLNWQEGRYLDAAVIGEYLAKRHSDDPAAEAAAQLAISSLQKLYQQNLDGGDGTTFASQELQDFSNFVTTRWAGTNTADAAYGVLVNLALRDNRLDDARKVLESVDPDRRPALELRLASAAWEKAVRAAATADEANRSQANQAKVNAAKMLAGAFETSRQQRPITASIATAALYLSQAQLDAGDYAAATKLLEDKEVGPLTLLARKSDAVDRPGYAAEAYKSALRAYVSSSPPRTDDALKTMGELEQAVESTTDSPATARTALTRIYFGLGIQLQQQIESLTTAGKSAEADRVGKAFAAFLTRLDSQAGDADWITRQWIGQTFLKLGEAGGSGPPSGERAEHYKRSAEVFQSMIDRAAKEPAFAPTPNSVLGARMQLGMAQRGLGDFEAAIETFSSILLEREAMLDVQKAAAYTYQEWGAADDPSQLDNAIRGARMVAGKNKNLIWGWSRLGKVAVQVARKNPKYKDLFFESWLNIAKCRYIGATKSDGANKTKQLASAERTIRSMERQYPDLGGPERKRDFDRLLKQIQKERGDKPVGLAAKP